MSSRITKSLPFLVAPAEATATGALPLTSMDKAQTKRNTMSSRVTKSLPFVVAPAEATPTGALPLTAMERAHTKRSTMSSRVTKSLPFLVAPAEATPTGALPLTAMDRALASLPMSAMFVYEKPIDQPAETMRRALSRALVPYYPIAGRLTVTGDQLKIVCTGEGVAFVGASASCTLQDARLSGPSPVVTVDDMTMNYVGQHSKDPPLLLMQVTEFSCGGFVVGVTWNHVVTDGAGMVQFLQAVGEFARGLPSYPSILPLRMDLALAELPPPITTMTKALINSKHSDFPSSYITVPLSFVVENSSGKVLRLKKALYGLRQAPRAWNARLDSELLKLGFVRNPLEHAVYRRSDKDGYLLVGVYVDDLIITGPSKTAIEPFKKEMKRSFSMSDLGLLTYYLGIQVNQIDGVTTLCQSSYTSKILEQAGMLGCNPCHVPMENRLKLSKNDKSPNVDKTKYRSIIGSLRYLVNTRPDIAYAVGIVSRYMEDPKASHWAAVKQILRYLSGTVNYGCIYKKLNASEKKLTGYSDSDLAGDIDDRKSTRGSVFLMGSNLVTWVSQKQRVVALSSCEAEYIASANAACQGIWLSRLLGELLGIPQPKVKLLVDNKAAIALSKNPVHHERSKHIDTRYHFIRECVENGEVDIDHVSTNEQLADILTKALGRVRFLELRQQLGAVEVQRD